MFEKRLQISGIVNWIQTEWLSILIPAIIFGVTVVLTFWLRKLTYNYIKTRLSRDKYKSNERIINITRGPSAIWCLLISIFLALHISVIPADWKQVISHVMWTLLLISLVIPLVNIASASVLIYGRRLRMTANAVSLSRNVVRMIILFIAVMILLEIWKVPLNIIYISLAVAFLALILAFRDAFPNFFAGIQIGANQQVKVGDYIKLDTGEEGYINKIGWNNTSLHTLEESTITVPNNLLIKRTVVNFGRPLKGPTKAFQFNSQKITTELTGLMAKNLTELREYLRIVPDEVIFCHTYRCLEENPYRAMESPNDFGAWIRDVLDDQVLAKQLFNIHVSGTFDLRALQENLVSVLDGYLLSNPVQRDAPAGKGFYFVKAFRAIWPTHYYAHDLREFAECLRKVGLNSIYFHFVGSRFQLKNGANDFSVWLGSCLAENELGKEIERLDPYAFSPENLRSELIRHIEKHIK